MKTTYKSNFLVALFLLLAIPGGLLIRPLVTGKEKEKPQSKPPTITDTRPASSSPNELAKRIDETIDGSEFAYARWGVSVISLSNGTVVYQRNADKLFTPASNMKIYTTAVALDLLGADYRWRTSVYANAQPDSNGTVQGDLVLYGRGAPDFVARSKDNNTNSVAALVDSLYSRGIRRVTGNVIGDESYFRGNPWGDGWQWTDMQWYFGAQASALSINGNEIDLNVVPATAKGEAATARTTDLAGYVNIDNRMAVGEHGKRPTVGVYRGLSDNNVQVWGEFEPGGKGFGARLSVYNPALWAAKIFISALKARGISVDGAAASRDSRTAASQRFDPAHSVQLASTLSAPLSEVARHTNKESINLNAELILRTLGRERGEMTSVEAGGRELGDDETGLSLIRLWLSRANIPIDRLALHDGSGLSRLDLVTPDSAARLLVSISKTGSAAAFRESLPIAGRDGTLAGRLGSLADKVSAKTGSLTYDNCLSGYITTHKGEVLAFSIMCNDQTGHGSSTRIIDEIVQLLAGVPDQAAKKP
jgi:D-alanyl-D-alanine carboxypeptidase/D-alanyl-D-alanine-endopeptidase (penicillin-binding protein 4)